MFMIPGSNYTCNAKLSLIIMWDLSAAMSDCLEDDVLVVLVAQQVFAVTCLVCCFLRLAVLVGGLGGLLFLSYGLSGGSVALLLRRHLLQAVELLAVQLIKL